MNLTITSIADPGELQKERLVLKVEIDTDVGFFAVFRVFVREGVMTNFVTDAYWFPNKAVSAGDQVVLYSKSARTQRGSVTTAQKYISFTGR